MDDIGMISRKELQGSKDWKRSVGKTLLATHYREVDGNRHAVCRPGSDQCFVHEDQYNPHSAPVRHLIVDAPEVIMAVVGVAFFGVKTANRVRKLLR